jgi:hypothetical protein
MPRRYAGRCECRATTASPCALLARTREALPRARVVTLTDFNPHGLAIHLCYKARATGGTVMAAGLLAWRSSRGGGVGHHEDARMASPRPRCPRAISATRLGCKVRGPPSFSPRWPARAPPRLGGKLGSARLGAEGCARRAAARLLMR